MHINKSLRYIFFGITIFLIGALIIAAFKPDFFSAEEDETIPLNQENTFAEIINLEKQQKWNTLIPNSSEVIITKSGPKTGVGSKWEWQDKKFGHGAIEITNIKQNRIIEATITTFANDETSIMKCVWTLKAETQRTTEVSWEIRGDLGYPIGRFMADRIEDLLEGEMENSLAELAYIKGLPEKVQ